MGLSDRLIGELSFLIGETIDYGLASLRLPIRHENTIIFTI